MDKDNPRFDRRRVLRGTAVGLLGVGLAGCSGPGGEDEEEDGGEEEEEEQLQGPESA